MLVGEEVNLAHGLSDGWVTMEKKGTIVCLIMWSKKVNCDCSDLREIIVEVALTKHRSCIRET